ncbi:MAG: thiolase family protein [Nitrososphaerales archaeon]
MLSKKIAIVSYGQTPFSRANEARGEQKLNTSQYLAWAAEIALQKASLTKKDLDDQGLAVTRTMQSPAFWGCEVAENLGITPRLTIMADHGGVSPIMMLVQSAYALNAGDVDYVLCLAADAPQTVGLVHAPLEGYRRDFMNPFGVMSPNSTFAMAFRRHVLQYGTKPEHTGIIALTQRKHANLNPGAYFYKQPLTMDDYLRSRTIAEPLRLLDCVMPVNGGAAFIVTTEEKAMKMTDKPVYVQGFGGCDNYYHGSRQTPDISYMGMHVASKRAFEMAGVKISDLDFFQPYDDYTIAVLMQLEELGFCEKGKGGEFVEKTDLSYRGTLPLNTGGGQLSSGQPGLAGGMVNLLEGVRQLRGEGEQRQVKDCKIGMVTGLGSIQYARHIGHYASLILSSEA